MKLLPIAVTLALCALPAASAPIQTGVASIYTTHESGGSRVACPGKTLRDSDLVFAHRTMRCGTKARITYNGRSVVATCIDRGPYVKGRIIDLSRAAARAIGLPDLGRVTVEPL